MIIDHRLWAAATSVFMSPYKRAAWNFVGLSNSWQKRARRLWPTLRWGCLSSPWDSMSLNMRPKRSPAGADKLYRAPGRYSWPNKIFSCASHASRRLTWAYGRPESTAPPRITAASKRGSRGEELAQGLREGDVDRNAEKRPLDAQFLRARRPQERMSFQRKAFAKGGTQQWLRQRHVPQILLQRPRQHEGFELVW